MEEIIICSDLHPDVETGGDRPLKKLYVELPSAGINEETGLIVYINGYNGDAEAEYPRKVLKPYLANKYNCVVMESNYFGLRKVNTILPTESLIHNFNTIYRTNLDVELYMNKTGHYYPADYLLDLMAKEVAQRGNTAIDSRCQFMITHNNNEYESWGLIPAIDMINYTGMLVDKYKLNSRKMILYGMSYGGYVAKLMGKFAPHTFSVIVDKAGFSGVKLRHLMGHELMDPDYEIYANDIKKGGEKILLYFYFDSPWTIMDNNSTYYFSDAHRAIRSLMNEKHFTASETRYYVFHSMKDNIAPIKYCDKSMEILKNYNTVHYERINADMIGRSIFKSIQHDLRVSTRGLFDYVAEKDGQMLEKESAANDFTIGSRRCFDCGDREYVFQYTDDYKVAVQINKKWH